MMVLGRKVGERICIGDEIEIVVLEIRGSRARLGVVAPRRVSVRRSEQKPDVKPHRESRVLLATAGELSQH